LSSAAHQQPTASRSRSVLFLVNSLRVGGSERKTVRLASALAADNSEVALSYLNPPESLLPQLDPAVTALNLHRRGKFSIPALRRLIRIVRARKVRTLVAVNLYAALYAVLARLLSKDLPLYVVVSVNTTEFAALKERLQMLLYRHVLKRADLIVFGAERQRQLWCTRYGLGRTPSRTVVIYNGVDTAKFSRERVVPAIRPASASQVMLGTVGAFRVEKRQIDLVRAVRQLVNEGLDVGALLVGDGPQRSEIERVMRSLGLEERVRLVGEAEDVRPYLAAMDVFVLPSVAVETFSNAALEAMAMSCPVVASQVGGMEEMLRFGGGVTYPPGDLKSLCDLLRPLVSDATARTLVAKQAREVVASHFSFAKMLSEFEEQVLAARWQEVA
jgi:glycosyltransferase involved in cell wall biosynthesis